MMERAAVIEMIQQAVTDADILLEGVDCNFTATVISSRFEGVRPVARQQMLLEAFTAALQSGDLHALSLKAFTPSEWERYQQSVPVTIHLEGLTGL